MKNKIILKLGLMLLVMAVIFLFIAMAIIIFINPIIGALIFLSFLITFLFWGPIIIMTLMIYLYECKKCVLGIILYIIILIVISLIIGFLFALWIVLLVVIFFAILYFLIYKYIKSKSGTWKDKTKIYVDRYSNNVN